MGRCVLPKVISSIPDEPTSIAHCMDNDRLQKPLIIHISTNCHKERLFGDLTEDVSSDLDIITKF
jgi:hypothetical protein